MEAKTSLDKIRASSPVQHMDKLENDGVGNRVVYAGPCPVCGDEIDGYHYGIQTCGSCKSFFKNCIYDIKIGPCLADGDCEIDKTCRTKCRFCRFQRCIMAGMSYKALKPVRKKGGVNQFATYYRDIRHSRQQAARHHPPADLSQPTNGPRTGGTPGSPDNIKPDPSTTSNVFSGSSTALDCLSVTAGTPSSSSTVQTPAGSSTPSGQPHPSLLIGPLTEVCTQHPHLLMALTTPPKCGQAGKCVEGQLRASSENIH